MINLPRPIGFGAMLADIAAGVGDGAREVVRRSRSPVGAMAMRRAEVEVRFELAARTESAGDSVGPQGGLGVRTFRFSAERTASEASALNTGFVRLEIVAIAEPPDDQPPPDFPGKRPSATPPAKDALTPASIREYVASLRGRAGALAMEASQRAAVGAALERAMTALQAGALDDAYATLRKLDDVLKALEDGSDA